MIQEVAPHIFVETAHLGSNNTIISTDDGVILVDAPHRPTDAVAWRGKAEQFGEIQYLIHTDHHIDHTMGNFFLPGRVVAHSGTYDELANRFPTPEYVSALVRVIDPAGMAHMGDFAVRLPEITFNDELELRLGSSKLRLMFLNGHTSNTIGVLLHDEGVFISGDTVCSASLPAFNEANVQHWLDSLDRINQLDFDVLVTGHGDVKKKEEVLAFKRLVAELIDRVTEAKASGLTKEQAAKTIRYRDNIHVPTKDWAVAYPEHLVEGFQVNSVKRIYDQV